MNILLYLWA